MRKLLDRVAAFDAHHRVVISLVVAAVVALATSHEQLWVRALLTYDSFALFSLLLISPTIFLTPTTRIKKIASIQDVGRTVILVVVVLAACSALFAVGFLVRNGKADAHHHFSVHVILALVTVALSWFLVHTIYCFRYAHRFYSAPDGGFGLIFPKEEGSDEPEPDYRDFLYFSFVVGMTCQVSDVQITSRAMRQLALLHGVLSFGFNTAILALMVNTVSSLLS